MKTVQIYIQDTPIGKTLSGVAITGTAGQFSCNPSTFTAGDTINLSGVFGGSGSITGYTNPKTYYIISTNGTTTFTLSATSDGIGITTTAGSTTGLTFIAQPMGQYNRIDLFKDEKISVTSSVQNINDIAKTFSDFSQTFTVPASVNNNIIFKHWYENANDYGFSTLKRSLGYIEIDTIPFRVGKIELKSVKVVDGRPESYTIAFIGSLGTLKDKFSNLYLRDLDSKSADYSYGGDNVFLSVIGEPNLDPYDASSHIDLMWPLISSARQWNYANPSGNDPTNNINNINYPIDYKELFPALRVKKIFELISEDSKWNINFGGSFLSDPRFISSYLWMKNTEVFKPYNYVTRLMDFESLSGGLGNGFDIDLATNTIKLKSEAIFVYEYSRSIKAIISGTGLSVGVEYTIHTYKNNILLQETTLIATGGLQEVTMFSEAVTFGVNNTIPGYADVYTFGISSNGGLVYSVYIKVNLTYRFSPGFGATVKEANIIAPFGANVTDGTASIAAEFPEIKIEDFVTGIIKMFNLVCYSEDNVNFTIEQLEDFYNKGNFVNITEYVRTDNATLNSVPPYNKINFQYDKSEGKVNVAFVNKNGIEYGDLRAPLDFDGPEYSVKLPFEDLGFSNLKDPNATGNPAVDKLQVGYAFKPDGQKYVTKPVILYSYLKNNKTVLPSSTFYFRGASSTFGVTGYKAFGQETRISPYGVPDIYGLNFPTQKSTLTGDIVEKGLYNQYYSDYLNNTFRKDARVLSVTAILPTSILTSIKLNDRIVIRDKKYLINTMTTDLTSGEVQFSLLTDFRVEDQQQLISTTLINEESWAIKNLDVSTYRNGDPIPQVTDPTTWAGLTSGAWCYYNNDETNGAKYGKLYNWYAVSDSRGLAPVGFHIPTSSEWSTLLNTTPGGTAYAGYALKEEGFANWASSFFEGADIYDFTALPTGTRGATGAFTGLPNTGIYHSATAQDTSNSIHVTMAYNSGAANTGFSSKKIGKAVRIIAD